MKNARGGGGGGVTSQEAQPVGTYFCKMLINKLNLQQKMGVYRVFHQNSHMHTLLVGILN